MPSIAHAYYQVFPAEVEGEYNVNINKGNPYTHPPVDKMKNIGISSFVVRGNIQKKKTKAYKTTLNLKLTHLMYFILFIYLDITRIIEN